MIDWVWVPFEVDPRFDGYRVDRFLAERLTAYSRARVQKILEECRVMRNERPIKASARVRGRERILIAYPRREEAPLSPDATVPILFEDDALLVINKPANLLSHPTGRVERHTVLGVLKHARPDLKSLYLLHRLDRDTSGVLALGKTRAAARAWTECMENRQVKKEYLAVVRGTPHPRRGVINHPIGREGGEIAVRQAINVPGVAAAVTRYEVETTSLSPSPSPGGRGVQKAIVVPSPTGGGGTCRRQVGEASLVRAFPETGRLHQIRVHLASIGHPLLGDALYTGDGSLYLKMTRKQITAEDRESLGFPRLALHAERLQFPHPLTGKTLSITAPLPPDLAGLIDTLSSR